MADLKISQLTETTVLADADIFPVSIDISGSPVTRKVEFGTLRNYIFDGIATMQSAGSLDIRTSGGDTLMLLDEANRIARFNKISGDTSAGLLIEAFNGTDVALLGAGNTANVTFYGAVNTANTITVTRSASNANVLDLALINSSGTGNPSVSIQFQIGATLNPMVELRAIQETSGAGSDGALAIYTRASDVLAEKFRIASTGATTINAGASTNPLTINRTGVGVLLKLESTNTADNIGFIEYRGNGSRKAYLGFGGAGSVNNNFSINNNTSNGGIILATNNTDRWTMDISGYISHAPATSTATSGTVNGSIFTMSFAPTSGTGVFNNFVLAPTINQTGGANGITRGLYINPTLTASADFRAIEVATGAIHFGDATSLEIPNSSTPTVNADGEIAVDTSVSDFSHGIMKFYGGEEQGVVSMPIAEFTSPADGAIPTYNATSDEFEMVVPSGGGGSYQYVGKFTATGQNNISCTSLDLDTDTKYKIFVKWYVASLNASSDFVMTINTDTGSNYGWAFDGYGRSSNTNGAYENAGENTAHIKLSDAYQAGTFELMLWQFTDGSNEWKHVSGTGVLTHPTATGQSREVTTVNTGGVWASTANVTSIQFDIDGTADTANWEVLIYKLIES